ncbi:hypothetical protein A9513_031265 [Pseudomonas sp. AU12215]|nr:hypothetical protein A9513_031265 [Pseudomonas sp. AU12215]
MVIGHFLQKVMALPKDQQFQWGRAVPASNPRQQVRVAAVVLHLEKKVIEMGVVHQAQQS